MFVPREIKIHPFVGKHFKLKRDVEISKGTFKEGTVFKCIEVVMDGDDIKAMWLIWEFHGLTFDLLMNSGDFKSHLLKLASEHKGC